MQKLLRSLVYPLVLGLLPVGSASRAASTFLHTPDSGQPGMPTSSEQAHRLLADPGRVMGIGSLNHRVMHFHAAAAIEQPYQSTEVTLHSSR